MKNFFEASKILLFSFGLALFCAVKAFGEPPILLANIEEQQKKAASVLPIPAEATEEQQLAFIETIKESRANDVSVTDNNAILYKGLMFTQDEEYEEAVPYLEEVLRRDPSVQVAWEGLGWAYIKLDELEKGTQLWKYFQRLMPEQALPYTLLAQAAILHTDWAAADKNFRKSLSINPNQYDIKFWHAQNLLRIGNVDEADELFKELIKEDPSRLDIQLNHAALLTHRLEYDDAVEIYRHVNEELPGNPKFMIDQAMLELRVGELRTADQLCLDALEIDPENTAAMQLRADIAEIDGLNDLRPLRDVINDTTDPVAKAALQLRLANRCHVVNQRRPGTYSERFVLGLMAQAITNDPSNIESRILYAERLVEAEKLITASREAKYILEKFNRHNSRAKMILFEIAVREKRYEDAEQILADRYSNYDSSDPMAYYYRARIYAASGRYQDAITEIDKMEAAANQGCVFTLLYHDLTESDWTPVTSVRRLHEHIISLQREGWILVSPIEIPNLVGLKKGESRATPEIEERPPATARVFDYLRWCITGERKFKKVNNSDANNSDVAKPKKYFSVTFDDGLRSSLTLGTTVAEDFGVPFGIFSSTEPIKEYTPSRAGWEELRNAQDTGYWIVGSQLYSSYRKEAVDVEGLDIRPPLCNRLWIPSKNRLESMNEWDRRIRREFRDSRRILFKEMDKSINEIPMVAYPYGDVGQNGSCNLTAMSNPMQSILSEAARTYQLGFVQSASGYTISGDNLLLTRRYEPAWSAEGADIVRHAYEYHPSFIARKMRAELAMLMNRPNLAQEMVDVLIRDGYPEELCRELQNNIHAHFQNKPNRGLKPLVEDTTKAIRHEGEKRDIVGAEEDPDAAMETALEAAEDDAEHAKEVEDKMVLSGNVDETSDSPLISFDNPFVGAEIDHTKANDQIETVRYGIRGGFDINENTTFSLEYFISDLKQTVRPRWNAQVTTNVPYAESKYRFRMDEQEFRFRFTHRFSSGAILQTSFGQASKGQRTENRSSNFYTNLQDDLNSHNFVLDESETCTLLNISASFNPEDNLKLLFFYDRNFVPSAVKNVAYDSIGGELEWKPEDALLVNAKARYYSYEDDNAMFNATFDTLWELNPGRGVWAGFRFSTVTTSMPTDFYWTPYWDRRFLGMLRYQQARESFNLRLDFMVGVQGEKGRPDRAYEQPVIVEKEIMIEGEANTVVEQATEFVISEDQNTGYHGSWAISAKFEKELNHYFSLTIETEVVALREYIDHFVLLYLKAEF